MLSYRVNLEFDNFQERNNDHLTFRTFSAIEVQQNEESKYITLHAGDNLEILSASYQYNRLGFHHIYNRPVGSFESSVKQFIRNRTGLFST